MNRKRLNAKGKSLSGIPNDKGNRCEIFLPKNLIKSVWRMYEKKKNTKDA